MMMFRDRSVRAFSLLVFVAGSTALVGAAGAEWSGTPVHHRAIAAVAPPTTPTTDAHHGASRAVPHTYRSI